MNYYQPQPYQPQLIEQQINRLNQMQGNFNPYQQPMQQPMQQPQFQQQPQPPVGVVQVGGIEEVKAFTNYFDGQPHYFLDKASNKIYIKQLNMNGTPSILTYTLTVEEEEKKVEYATKEEVENIKNVIDNLLKNLGGQVNE